MPYKTAVGTTYDFGDFAPILDKALALSHYTEFKKRRRESFKRKKLRGIGVSCFLEHAGGMPTESASLLFPGADRLVLGIGVQNTGQGHATIYPRLIAAKLGIPAAQISHRHGDTNLDLKGNPSVGSRSTMTVGSALYRAVDLMLEKAKPIASGMLEAAETDIAYSEGHFEVVGTDRRVSLFEVAMRAAASGDPLDTKATVDTPQTFPNGCHIAEVEIDPDTGAVDDRQLCGGGRCRRRARSHAGGGPARRQPRAGHRTGADGDRVYDEGNGQLVTGTFMDYAMPRAEDMPPVARCRSQRAGDDESARRERRRRGRHHRLDRGDHECDRECDSGWTRCQHRHAGDTGKNLARLSRGLSFRRRSARWRG